MQRVEEIDAAIEAWTLQRSRDEVLAVLDAAGVPAGRVYSVADIATDPQYLAREMIVEAPTSDGRTLKVPGVVPKLSATPGRIAYAAPRLGEHDDDLQARAAGPRASTLKEMTMNTGNEHPPPHQRSRDPRRLPDGDAASFPPTTRSR